MSIAFLLQMMTLAALQVTPQSAPALVSTEWLAANLDDERLVVLHVGNEASYAEGHVPGARLMPLAAFTTERDGLTTEMPDPEVLREALEAAGVSNGSRVVVYAAAHPPTLAARLYVTLEHFGLGARASVLDGGLRAWRGEDRPVSTEPAPASRGATLELPGPGDRLVDHTYVQSRLDDASLAIVDARDSRFWTGAERNQQRAARAGRVPGALNVPFSSLVDESGRFLDPDALAALFAEAGVARGQPIVAYCHIGQQASLLFLAARHLGHDVRLYDGSFEDWSRRSELPVEAPGGPGG